MTARDDEATAPESPQAKERATTPSLHPPSMGRVAHAAFCESLKGDLPEGWDDLSDEERAAWEAAASAVCG